MVKRQLRRVEAQTRTRIITACGARSRRADTRCLGVLAGQRDWLPRSAPYRLSWLIPHIKETDHVRDEPGPARLMRGAEPGAVVAVEVLVEDEIVFPRGIVLQTVDPPEAGPPPVWAYNEDRDEPILQVSGDHVERHPMPRADRIFEGELVTEEPV